jgi:D-alanyl-D-alanine carboxypeptidase/D-alanyl-D-alanine-endopeptidase (penicillin-binding protein 4)
MLKKSDDLIANVIFKTLGARYFQTMGTWVNGAAAVKAILAPATGINFEQLVIVDGAGLSRYNLASPAQFIRLLNYTYHSLPARIDFYQALPTMGIDGTLAERLKNTPYANKIHAKTGTMASTSTLVGYVQTNHQQTLAFAILINGFVGSPEKYQALEDQICKALTQS